ncbi:hypothetical protein E2C01_003894 [Portunus trituberculatus]|uniref:Uncharacterized protein n=1 Tax=Portunus trituberculatus TaxID=210409 RepID=A0A5B7CNF8_PORTR|nr:hypothetical protein [Portunus trituberculatus]
MTVSEMEDKTQLCAVVVVVILTAAGKEVCGELIDYKAWLGEEPLTPQRIVNDMVEYFSVRDPHGIPVLNVPEPIHIPGTVPASQITFFDPYISGHSGLRLEYVNVNLTSLSMLAPSEARRVHVRTRMYCTYEATDAHKAYMVLTRKYATPPPAPRTGARATLTKHCLLLGPMEWCVQRSVTQAGST